MRVRLALALGLGLCSCAHSYVDADGVTHVVGLVKVDIDPEADQTTVAGKVISVSTIGASWLGTGDGASLSLGYNKVTTALLRDNALVLGSPLGAVTSRTVRTGDAP